jgi:hypothetical protein
MAQLERRMPSLILMNDLTISISHSGGSKICRNCLKYHKRDKEYVEYCWLDYNIEFKEDIHIF